MTAQSSPEQFNPLEERLQLLERLCNASGVSGSEGQVRSIVVETVRQYQADRPGGGDVKVDALGNVLAVFPGHGENRLRVMIAAHMDEVGFMLTHREDDGIYRFDLVGGLDVRQLAGKAVLVGRDQVPGVIGAKPIHLTKREELNNPIGLDTLRIDVGPGNGEKVKVGDRAVFATRFTRLGPSLLAKALDDRLGVATLLELARTAPTNIDLLAAFTVQEEVGLRGAQTAAYALDPQLGIAVDCTPANDLEPYHADEENFQYNTRLGFGPALYLSDRGTISDPRLVRHFVRAADEAGIPYQFRQPGGGGTDASAIHKTRMGVPSISVSVPGRYLHTAAGLVRTGDWENTLALIHAALASLPHDILAQEL
jgi:tetrahedral aminopeptidase